jgi:hypothetical protein
VTTIALVVEGPGDADAFPVLATKTGLEFGHHIIAPRPIRAGSYLRLQRAGELERFVVMAATRQEADVVLIVVDLDDGCASEFHEEFARRAQAAADPFGKPVRVCFCIREYECWFLEDVANLIDQTPEIPWVDGYACANPPAIRGAKEELKRAMRKNYKETQDQSYFTRKLNLGELFVRSRSYRKFVKSVTGMSYEALVEMRASEN